MTSDTIFDCGECGGPVAMLGGLGRKYGYKIGIELPIPQDWLIATCRECGETYFTSAEIEALEATLELEFVKTAKV